MPIGLNSDVFVIGASASDEARLAAEIADFYLPPDARLDDRTRTAISHLIGGIIGAVEADLRGPL